MCNNTENNNSITIGERVFEVVDKIPANYEILTGMKGLSEGYLPVAHAEFRNPVKVVQTPAAQKILSVAECGFKTLSAMEDYVAQNQDNTSPWAAYRLQKIQEILPVMQQLFIAAKNTDEDTVRDQHRGKKASVGSRISKKLLPYRQALDLIKVLKASQNAQVASGLDQKRYVTALSTIRNTVVEHMQKIAPYPFDVKIVRHLRGEAVFFQELRNGVFTKECKMARWVICDNVDKEAGQITFSHVGTFSLDDYGKTWQVFKYKPAK